jgi:hypothetical protein
MTTPVKGGARRKVAKEALTADKDPSKPGEGGAVGDTDELDMAAPVIIGAPQFAGPKEKPLVKPETEDLKKLAWDGREPGTLVGALGALEFFQSTLQVVEAYGLSERVFMVYLMRVVPETSAVASLLRDNPKWEEFSKAVQTRYLSVLTPGTLVGYFMGLRQERGETAMRFIQRARRIERHLEPLRMMGKGAAVHAVCSNLSEEWTQRNRGAIQALYNTWSLGELEEALGLMISRRAVDDTVQQLPPQPAKWSGARERGPGEKKKEKVGRCYKCGEEGHVRAECPKNTNKANNPGNAGQGGASGGRQ